SGPGRRSLPWPFKRAGSSFVCSRGSVMRFETYLRQSAQRFPDKTALVAGGRRLTYSQLDDLSDELAQGLAERGIERGDRVVLFLDNSVEAVVSVFAVTKAGAVFSPVNPSTKADKLAYILNNCRARAL